MRTTFIWLAIAVLIALDIYASMQHHRTWNAMENFMNAGGRNTAGEGFERDDTLYQLEARVSNLEHHLARIEQSLKKE